jgi:hypothetical protein
MILIMIMIMKNDNDNDNDTTPLKKEREHFFPSAPIPDVSYVGDRLNRRTAAVPDGDGT